VKMNDDRRGGSSERKRKEKSAWTDIDAIPTEGKRASH